MSRLADTYSTTAPDGPVVVVSPGGREPAALLLLGFVLGPLLEQHLRRADHLPTGIRRSS